MILFLKIILYTAQGIALWVAILNWNENKNTNQRYFLHFMIFVVLIEIAANLFRIYTTLGNSFVYNIFIISSFFFFFYWFFLILKKKKIVIWLVSIYVIFLIASLFLEPFFDSMLNITLYAGTLLILILTIMYYNNLLKKPEVVDFLNLQPFWIATGLFIFYIGFMPVQFIDLIDDFNPVSYQFVMVILNIILYGCISKALLCPQKQLK